MWQQSSLTADTCRSTPLAKPHDTAASAKAVPHTAALRTPQHSAHRSTLHTDLPRGAVLSAEIRHHKLNEAPRELQAIEDDDTAADNIDDAQSLICEFGAEQGNNCRNT